MKETRAVIYQVTADKSGYSSYSQERIPLTRCSRWKRNCTYKHSSVFSIWTLRIYKFYFQLMYYWQWASVNTKKYARLPAAVQEMSPRPSSFFPFSGREKAGPEGAAEVEPKQKKILGWKRCLFCHWHRCRNVNPPRLQILRIFSIAVFEATATPLTEED